MKEIFFFRRLKNLNILTKKLNYIKKKKNRPNHFFRYILNNFISIKIFFFLK
jgi:hypothetical protein